MHGLKFLLREAQCVNHWILVTEGTHILWVYSQGIYTHQNAPRYRNPCYPASIQRLSGVMLTGNESSYRPGAMCKQHPSFSLCWNQKWFTDSSTFIQRRDMNNLITFQPGAYTCVRTSSPCLRTLRVDLGPLPQATYNCGVSSLAKSAICQQKEKTCEPARKCSAFPKAVQLP